MRPALSSPTVDMEKDGGKYGWFFVASSSIQCCWATERSNIARRNPCHSSLKVIFHNKRRKTTAEWVSSFLTAHQHILSYLVPKPKFSCRAENCREAFIQETLVGVNARIRATCTHKVFPTGTPTALGTPVPFCTCMVHTSGRIQGQKGLNICGVQPAPLSS